MSIEEALFISRIRHDKASFIEIRRGEGISGGDMVIIGVDESDDEEYRDFMFFSPQLKLNRYRLSAKIRSIKVDAAGNLIERNIVDAEDLRSIEEKLAKEGRASLPTINDDYPSLTLILVHHGSYVDIRVELGAPAQRPQ